MQKACQDDGAMRLFGVGSLFCVAAVACSVPVLAEEGMSEISGVCTRAAQIAAQQSGVPVSVLKAIALTETGRRLGRQFGPWPWTVNMEGDGHWFRTVAEAKAFVMHHFERGARSFDVGCFQINYKWHGDQFASIDQMFDPIANAAYAARFLKTLHAETGSWSDAAGAYHSRTPEQAQKYQARFDGLRARYRHEDLQALPEIPDIVLAAAAPAADPPPPRVNTYPFLQTGARGGLASLVPIGNGGGASLFPAAPRPFAEVRE